MRDCSNCPEPEVDDTSIDCDGKYVSTDCVEMGQGSEYLGVYEGDSLTKFIFNIVSRIKTLVNLVGGMWNLKEFPNDTAASAGGISKGKPYVTPDGFVKIRKN